MPIGLRVWDAAGQLKLDTNTKTGRVIGMLSVGGDSVLHAFDVPRDSGEKVFAHLLIASAGDARGQCRVGDDFSAGSGSNRVWYFVETGSTGYLIYGVY